MEAAAELPLPVSGRLCPIHMGHLEHLAAVPNWALMLGCISSFLKSPVWLNLDDDVHLGKHVGFAIIYIPLEALPRLEELNHSLIAIFSGFTARCKTVATLARQNFLDEEAAHLQPLLQQAGKARAISLTKVTNPKVFKISCPRGPDHIAAAVSCAQEGKVRCPECQQTWMKVE